jgi:acyl-CoA thioesterase-2
VSSPGAPTSAPLHAALRLDPTDAGDADLAFLATTQDCPWPKAYGGDMVAQGLAALMRSVSDGKTLHSTHGYFLRPVDIGAAVRYEVEVLRDGRGYSARQVRALQNGKLAFTALASFTAGGDSGSYALDPPPGLPGPEDLPSSAAYLADRTGGTMTDRSRAYWAGGRSFDMRHVPGPVYLTIDGDRTPHQAVWVRPFSPLQPVEGLTDGQRDLAALAYACDYTILEPLLRSLGLPWAMPGLTTASLDHAMWFHRTPPAGLSDWLLYTQQALAADAARGTATGQFFTRDHVHVATVVQEGVLRAS